MEVGREWVRAYPGDARGWVSYGGMLQRSGDSEGAEEALREGLRLEPTDLSGLLNLASVLYDRRDVEGARALLDRAVEAHPGVSSPWVNRAQLEQDQGEVGAAERDYRRGLEALSGEASDRLKALNQLTLLGVQGRRYEEARAYGVRWLEAAPGDANALYLTAEALKGLGRWQEALGLIEQIPAETRVQIRDGAFWHTYGLLLNLAQRNEESEEAIGRAVEFIPNDADVWVDYGIARRAMGRADARAVLERWLPLAPEHSMGWTALGTLQYGAGSFGEALESFERALEGGPMVQALIGKASVCARLQRTREGVEALDQALGLQPGDAMVLGMRARYRLELGDVEGALADAEACLEAEPGRVSGLLARARVRRTLGRYEGALEDFDRVVSAEPTAAHYEERGSCRLSAGQVEGALSDAEAALRRDRRRGGAWVLRGRAKLEAGAFEGAIADFSGVLSAVPDHAEALLYRGIARVKAGDASGALADLERALEVAGPNEDEALARLRALLE